MNKTLKLVAQVLLILIAMSGTALSAKKKATTNAPAKDTAADTTLASSLVRAIDNCDLEAVRGLISAGANINKRSSEYKLPPFIMAFEAYKKPEESCQEVFRYIESLKPDANQIEYSGRNILYRVHTLKGFNYYIEKGADYKIKDNSGNTVIHEMLTNETTSLNLEMFLKRHIKSVNAGRPVEEAISSMTFGNSNGIADASQAIEIIELLIGKSPELINVQDNNGDTPLMLAIARRANKTAWWLMAHGADYKIKNKRGKTAYDFAIGSSEGELITLLSNAKKGVITPWPPAPQLVVAECGRYKDTIKIVAGGRPKHNYNIIPIDATCVKGDGFVTITAKVGNGAGAASFDLFKAKQKIPASGAPNSVYSEREIAPGTTKVMNLTFEKSQIWNLGSEVSWKSTAGIENTVDLDISITYYPPKTP